jgi:hypothetical protein
MRYMKADQIWRLGENINLSGFLVEICDGVPFSLMVPTCSNRKVRSWARWKNVTSICYQGIRRATLRPLLTEVDSKQTANTFWLTS